ncbi:MAG: hypothetical protein Q9167_002974 [Letrouitia subvulpina]
MSEKKRKRVSQAKPERPSKRHDSGSNPPDSLRISLFANNDQCAPVIASSPGLPFPSDLLLKAYQNPRPRRSSYEHFDFPKHEYLLHTSSHPKLDYTAREEESSLAKNPLFNHYIAIYDPSVSQLTLIPSRTLKLRACLRQLAASQPTEEEIPAPPTLSTKKDLALTFGNKKTQKIIHAMMENSIPQAGKSSASSPSSSSKQKLDPVASAVLESMSVADNDNASPSKEDLQALADDAKPRPKPHLDATRPKDVYPIEELVGGRDTLRGMHVREWETAVERGEEVFTRSRFVSARIATAAKAQDVRGLKVLRYLLLLLEWYRALEPINDKRGSAKGIYRVLHMEKLQSKLAGWGHEVIRDVGRRFAEAEGGGRGNLSRWQVDRLITHVCAIAVTVDGFVSDVHDIREDLRLENQQVRKYYAEIGCKVGPPTEAERTRMGIGKAEAKAHLVAKLKLPLEFPKAKSVPKRMRR